eukprot:1159601-Pelagomonas_calceolata.AAC.2
MFNASPPISNQQSKSRCSLKVEILPMLALGPAPAQAGLHRSFATSLTLPPSSGATGRRSTHHATS